MIRSEHFYDLVEHSLDGIILATENGNILYVNAALCQLVQRRAEEIRQGGWQILFRDGDKKFEDAWFSRKETGNARTELEIVNSRGIAIPVEISTTNFTGKDGKLYYSTTYRDITERKAKENELLELKDRLQALSDSAFEGIVININGVVLDVNNTMANMFGYKPEEMIGMTAEDLVIEECVPLVQNQIQQNYEKPYQVIGRKKNGNTFPMEVCGKSIVYKGRKARITSFRDISQIISAEKEIIRYENKYQALLQNGSDMLSLLNENAEYIYVSPSVERILGYRPEQLVGVSALQFIHPEDIATVQSRLNSVINSNTVIIPDFRFRHANGVYVWIETVLDNMLGNKHVKAISASSRDVTQRKQAEFILKQKEAHLQNALLETIIAEQRFRSLFEQNPNAVFSIDANGIITSANNIFTDIMKVPIADILGRHVLTIFSAENNKNLFNKLDDVLKGASETFTTQFVNSRGQFMRLFVSVAPIIINTGVTGAFFIARDITESWQNEHRLSATKQMLQKAASNADLQSILSEFLLNIDHLYATFECAITLLQYGKLYHYVAPSFPESHALLINGISVEEPDIHEMFSPTLVTDIAEETSLGIFKDIVHQAKIEAYISYPLVSTTGKVFGYFTVSYKDKNKFDEKHIEIAGHLARLISLVMDNRESLENIKKQNKELQKINAELDRFAYSTSHELRSPLTSIKGLVTLALHDVTDAKDVSDYLNMIESSTVKLEKFIMEIGDYYLNKSTVVSYQPVQLNIMVKESINSVMHLNGAEGLNFDINIDPHLCLFSDPQRLDIVLNNVLDNAIKYSDRSKPDQFINVSAAKKNGSVIITVEDNG
ncbi:MAG: sensor histidine kinase, partial [Bacteroidia bacterium]